MGASPFAMAECSRERDPRRRRPRQDVSRDTQDAGGGSVVLPGARGSSFASQDFASTVLVGRAKRDIGRSFVGMLRGVPTLEATPYVYYVLAWPWTRLFGFGEAGLRSLSALAGTLIVPVTYAEMTEWCRHSSRAAVFDTCSSTFTPS